MSGAAKRSGAAKNRRLPGWWGIGPGGGRTVLATVLGLSVMLSAAVGLIVFTAERLHRADASKSTTELAECLGDNDAANLTVDGEALIERACRQWVRNRAVEAACVLHRHATMTDEDATKLVERQCGVEAPSL